MQCEILKICFNKNSKLKNNKKKILTFSQKIEIRFVEVKQKELEWIIESFFSNY